MMMVPCNHLSLGLSRAVNGYKECAMISKLSTLVLTQLMNLSKQINPRIFIQGQSCLFLQSGWPRYQNTVPSWQSWWTNYQILTKLKQMHICICRKILNPFSIFTLSLMFISTLHIETLCFRDSKMWVIPNSVHRVQR